jgi:hypothetical protein
MPIPSSPQIKQLDNLSAHIKDNPIRYPSDMSKKLEWTPINNEWKENISTCFWSTSYKGDIVDHLLKIIALRDKLLSFGGDEACMPVIEPDLNDIISRGQLWPGTRIKMMEGETCHCHANSAYLWDANRHRTVLATGYALSNDGMWRQHSWVVQLNSRRNTIIETTKERIAYFGFVMTEEEGNKFLQGNAC